MTQTFTNHLISETSLYLLQHAHNPVDWYPWCEEALQKAKDENKVILVSIGYAACHWCHVMERESFENEAVADIMNEHFINIKIDREERPDLDHIYMDAVQAIAGSGGWPLNVFLTPDAKPFYGGTYFPPKRAYNRASWTEVLQAIQQAWQERRHEIEAQAEELMAHLQKANSFGQAKFADVVDTKSLFMADQCHAIAKNFLANADTVWGGFGKAPKFPQTFTITYLLQYYHFFKNDQALQQALLSLDKMIQGGIYDQIGGGFARYSTDEEWLAPHFEKMLYDNALLITVLCDAYQITKNKLYGKTIRQTIDFLQREMMDAKGGFYAALDADSEGVEGKYYVWQKEEVVSILGNDAELFCQFYNITDQGNWEGVNILRVLQPVDEFANERKINVDELKRLLDEGAAKLLTERNKRIRPALDDKILLSWNALMITALCKAAATFKDEYYKTLAKGTYDFIKKVFFKADGSLYHTYKNGQAKYDAFLDDYANLIQAAIALQEITSHIKYLYDAQSLTEQVINLFSDEQNIFFYYTSKVQKDIILRKKEIYDGATASGNSGMANNLQYLAIIFDNNNWRARSEHILQQLSTAVVKYPGSFGNWASLLLKYTVGINEIVITGKEYRQVREELLQKYVPNKVLQCAADDSVHMPLLLQKKFDDQVLIYLCKQYQCLQPLNSLKELYELI